MYGALLFSEAKIKPPCTAFVCPPAHEARLIERALLSMYRQFWDVLNHSFSHPKLNVQIAHPEAYLAMFLGKVLQARRNKATGGKTLRPSLCLT